MTTFDLRHGDSLAVLPTLPAASFDACVTDPPYELGFMGAEWDRSGIACNVELWRGVLRVLKPGGHLLAFGGTRTYHRMACAIEDAGFEIRDQLGWLYGSGFPKSLDIAKAMDGADKIGFQRQRALRFTEFMRSTGLTAGAINTATQSSMGSHYLTDGEQPAVATEEMFCHLRPLIRARDVEIPEWIEGLVRWRTVESANLKARATVRVETMTDTSVARPACAYAAQAKENVPRREVAITAPHSDLARQWAGWGTALKPAWEPIVLARRPLARGHTIAANVAAHGTGAINIDGCRIGTDGGCQGKEERGTADGVFAGGSIGGPTPSNPVPGLGRFPANVLHDGSPEVLDAFAAAGLRFSGSAGQTIPKAMFKGFGGGGKGATTYGQPDGDGSVSRFYYCAKASGQDRAAGLSVAEILGGAERPRLNHHPTVKPTELMRYLCRLVTPPGGAVLDPFTGSGSTGRGALLEGFAFVGIEREADYVALARARITEAAGPLFAQG